MRCVAPYAGAWIEIFAEINELMNLESLPTRERGLKWSLTLASSMTWSVAPYAGAWIEIKYPLKY